jgi:protein-L-isoaspartate(D-aspartate) O-methyltransferase
MVLARLLQEAQIGPRDRVLDIGCASGYSTMLIAGLAGSVVGVESDQELAAHARRALADLGASNAGVVEGPLDGGHPMEGPYNVILIFGSVAEIPSRITDQLAEGGRLLTVLRPPARAGHAVLLRRIGGSVSSRPLFDAATPYLPGFEPKPVFQF